MEKVLLKLKIKTKPAEEQVPVLVEEIERLDSALDEKSEEARNAKEELDVQRRKYSALETERDAYVEDLKTEKGVVADLDKVIVGINSDLNSEKEKVSTLSDAVKEANNKISELDEAIEKSAAKPTMKIDGDLCYINVKAVKYQNKEYSIEEIKKLPEIAIEIYKKGGQTFTKVNK